MKSILYSVIIFCQILLPVRAQELPATLLLQDKSMLKGFLLPRKAGTTQLQFKEEEKEGIRNFNLSEIDEIQFDLTAFKTRNLHIWYETAQYPKVVEELKGRVIPYFRYVDLECNSNALVELFIQSLYRTGNHAGVHAAGKEVSKYDVSGDVRRLADVYQALSHLDKGEMEAFTAYESYFQEIDREDRLAPALWMGLAKKANKNERPDQAIPPLAKLIVEAPMETEWSAEALYLSAVYHHTRTNLVVANQICQEIQIVAPLTQWPKEAEALQKQIKTQAEELEIVLVDFGEFREGEKDAGESKVDYRDRQRALEEQELEFTE